MTHELRPMNFFDELASNISAHNMSWILYSGNSDSLDAHRGTESKVTIYFTRILNHLITFFCSYNPGNFFFFVWTWNWKNLWHMLTKRFRILHSVAWEDLPGGRPRHGWMIKGTSRVSSTRNGVSRMPYLPQLVIRYRCTLRERYVVIAFFSSSVGLIYVL
jgi:hypothetical protein